MYARWRYRARRCCAPLRHSYKRLAVIRDSAMPVMAVQCTAVHGTARHGTITPRDKPMPGHREGQRPTGGKHTTCRRGAGPLCHLARRLTRHTHTHTHRRKQRISVDAALDAHSPSSTRHVTDPSGAEAGPRVARSPSVRAAAAGRAGLPGRPCQPGKGGPQRAAAPWPRSRVRIPRAAPAEERQPHDVGAGPQGRRTRARWTC